MKKNIVTIKNTGITSLILDLTPYCSKIIDLEVGSIAGVKVEEYEYMLEIFKSFFEKGKLSVIKAPKNVEIIKNDFKYDEKKIDEIVQMTQAKFKTEISKVDDIEVLRIILKHSIDEGKTEKFLKIIETRIDELKTEDVAIASSF